MSEAVQIPRAAVGSCRSCGAEVLWVKTERGKTMPLDRAEVLVAGELLFVVDGQGVAHRYRCQHCRLRRGGADR